MVTAQITLETGLGLTHSRRPASSSSRSAPADFEQILTETNELLASAAADTGTEVESADDEFGYRWLILRDADFEDLVVSLNTVSNQLQGGGYGDRLLCAVFAFEEKGRPVYLIYNFKRGAYYPFVPAPGEQARDTERELRLKAQIGAELPIEEDTTRWFPLWEIPL